MHLADAGYKGGKCSYDRNKPADDYGFSSMAFVELLGPYQVFLLKKSGLFSFKDFGPYKATDLVVDHVAGYGGRHQNNSNQDNIDITTGSQGTDNEKEGVPGQKWSYHQTRFAKDNQKQD